MVHGVEWELLCGNWREWQ